MAIAITISIAVLLCVLTILLSYRYVKKTFTALDVILDSVLNKNIGFPLETVMDSRLSKLTHKAEKIIQMNNTDISQLGKEKDTIQGFISDMSHQMKTPLSGISMYIDLLMEGNISENEQQEFFLRIKKGTDNLQWMMDSLVKMSRLEVGAIGLLPVSTGIKQTISDSISVVLGEAAKKNISIQSDYFEDIPLFHDRKWTSEAMTNILENAIKYSEPNSKIHIQVATLPTYTKISFTDHGPGIAPKEWNSIFKRFYRGENVKNIGGAGLGLYLASMILEKQGGYILVNSKLEEYTTFSVFLQNCKK